MRRQVAVLVGAFAVALPPSHAVAALTAPQPTTRSVVWKRVEGPLVKVDRWGYLKVALVVKKTIARTNGTTSVTRRITAVRLPVWPSTGASHTIGLNKLVLPQLAQQVFRGQLRTRIQYISEATDTSVAFEKSLQAALLKARRV
jgi:uncharacterized protein with FMN-binding domain